MPKPQTRSPLADLRRIADVLAQRGHAQAPARPPGMPTARDIQEHAHKTDLLQTAEPAVSKSYGRT